MAETATIVATPNWVKVIDTADELWVLQNLGPGIIRAIYSDSAPDEGAQGHRIEPFMGMTPAVFGLGDVYIKAISDPVSNQGKGAAIVLTK